MMVVWRGSLTRSGGTVCQLIVEYILSRHGITQKKISTDDFATILNNPVRSHGAQGIDLIDVELKKLDAGIYLGGDDGFYSDIFHLPYFFTHFVRRDLRPATLSHMRLTNLPFEDALEVLHAKMALYDKFEALPDERCLKLDYERDILNISSGIKKLSNFIGMPITSNELSEASELFSKKSLRRKIEDQHKSFFRKISGYESSREYTPPTLQSDHLTFSVDHDGACSTYNLPCSAIDNDCLDVLRAGKLPIFKLKISLEDSYYDLIKNQDSRRTTFRASFDVAIGSQIIWFQQEHVSSEKQSDWRGLLTSEQLDRMNSTAMPFLDKYGYTL